MHGKLLWEINKNVFWIELGLKCDLTFTEHKTLFCISCCATIDTFHLIWTSLFPPDLIQPVSKLILGKCHVLLVTCLHTSLYCLLALCQVLFCRFWLFANYIQLLLHLGTQQNSNSFLLQYKKKFNLNIGLWFKPVHGRGNCLQCHWKPRLITLVRAKNYITSHSLSSHKAK